MRRHWPCKHQSSLTKPKNLDSFPQPPTCARRLCQSFVLKTSVYQRYSPHQHMLLGGAEIRHCCSGPQVVRDALSVQQLVRLVCRDVYVDDATKDLLRGCCQDHREDVIGVIWVGGERSQSISLSNKAEVGNSIPKRAGFNRRAHAMNIKCV